MRKRAWMMILAATLVCLLLGLLLYQLPPINSRISPRIRDLRTRVQYALNPPDEAIFVPGEVADISYC